MKAVVLAGGFAKRLWPLTKEQAKPLVDVGGRPIISYIMDKLDKSKHITEIIISTNSKFEQDFKKYLASQKFAKPVKIAVENTNHEGEKLGAVGGLNYVLEKEKIGEDVLVIGGDNLISTHIDEMISEFKERKKAIVAVYDIKDFEEVKKFGQVVHDKHCKITSFIEKPDKPNTTLIAICCYIFPASIKQELKDYIEAGNNRDAPGFFISWLASRKDVFAHVFDDYWFDIGDHQTLEKAREFARKNLN
jgi:glucose-1-phosphate thymidylyltransferase